MSKKAREKKPELPTPKILRAPEEEPTVEDTEKASREIAASSQFRRSDVLARDHDSELQRFREYDWD